VDEVDFSVSPDERRKKGESGRGTLWVERPQANASASGRVLVHRGGSRLLTALYITAATSRGGGRAEDGDAGKQRAAVQTVGCVLGHRMALHDGTLIHVFWVEASSRAVSGVAHS